MAYPIDMTDRAVAELHLSSLLAASQAADAAVGAAKGKGAAYDEAITALEAASEAYAEACDALADVPARTLADFALRARHADDEADSALGRAIIRDLRKVGTEQAADPVASLADEIGRLYHLVDYDAAALPSPGTIEAAADHNAAHDVFARIDMLELAVCHARARSAEGALYQTRIVLDTLGSEWSATGLDEETAVELTAARRAVASVRAWIMAETGAEDAAISRGLDACPDHEITLVATRRAKIGGGEAAR